MERAYSRACRSSLMLILALLVASCGGSSQATQAATLKVKRGDLAQMVSASGQIQALQTSSLNFVTAGTVAALKVAEGSRVQKGAVLASLDTSDLDLQITQAEANLASAQAALADLQDGPKDTDLRNAQAQLAAAQAQLAQQAQGNALPSDRASAQAQLESAQAALDALQNPTQDKRDEAQNALQQAQITLQQTRDSQAQSKTSAEIALRQASDALTKAQSSYSTAYWNWQYVQQNDRDPVSRQGKLNDSQRQQYREDLTQAEASLHSAEGDVAKAQASFDSSRQAEVTNVQLAEAKVADAQRQFDALQNPSSDQLAQAQAQVAQAQATLAKLGGGTASDVEVAQQTVVQRQAALDALTAPPSASELAQAQAQVAQAQAALGQARRNRANAEIVAPFDGLIAAVNISLGDNSDRTNSPDNPALSLIDDSRFHVEVNLSEADLGKVQLGQQAQVTVDALPGRVLSGTLDYIASTATTAQNVVTYLARVTLEPSKQPLRVGLSATVAIVSAQRKGVVLVPNIAIQEDEGGQAVLLRRDGKDQLTPIKTGLVGDTESEVLAGLQAGDTVVVNVATNSNQNGPRLPFGPPPGGGGGGRGPGG